LLHIFPAEAKWKPLGQKNANIQPLMGTDFKRPQVAPPGTAAAGNAPNPHQQGPPKEHDVLIERSAKYFLSRILLHITTRFFDFKRT